MFRTVSPSIIRSSRLYTQHQLYVIQVSWLLTSRHEMERVIQVIITKNTAPLATIVAVTSLITLHYYLKIYNLKDRTKMKFKVPQKQNNQQNYSTNFVISSHLVPASKQSTNLYDIRRITDAVCTVLNSWWRTERPSETCRLKFNKLENCASSWF